MFGNKKKQPQNSSIGWAIVNIFDRLLKLKRIFSYGTIFLKYIFHSYMQNLNVMSRAVTTTSITDYSSQMF